MNKATAAPPFTIAIVEDDPDVRHSLEVIIKHQPTLQCVASYGNAEDALRELPEIQPRLVFMDINLPGMSGVDCVRKLAQVTPKICIVMLTVYDDAEAIFKSLTAGAMGYLLKPVSSMTLLEAIEEVSQGGAPMSTKIARLVVQTFQKPAPNVEIANELSAREKEILNLLAKGYISKKIAYLLNISYWTVETHVAHIYQKLHVRSRAQAVAKYLGKTSQI